MSNKIKQARKVIREAFLEDLDFKRGYVDNIAMLLYDNQEKLTGKSLRAPVGRNEMAEKILNLLFSL